MKFYCLGDKFINIDKTSPEGMFRYIGEVDCYGKACGFGTAVGLGDQDRNYRGFFLDGHFHGVGWYFKIVIFLGLFRASGIR